MIWDGNWSCREVGRAWGRVEVFLDISSVVATKMQGSGCTECSGLLGALRAYTAVWKSLLQSSQAAEWEHCSWKASVKRIQCTAVELDTWEMLEVQVKVWRWRANSVARTALAKLDEQVCPSSFETRVNGNSGRWDWRVQVSKVGLWPVGVSDLQMRMFPNRCSKWQYLEGVMGSGTTSGSVQTACMFAFCHTICMWVSFQYPETYKLHVDHVYMFSPHRLTGPEGTLVLALSLPWQFTI